jgi:hypothetical protein
MEKFFATLWSVSRLNNMPGYPEISRRAGVRFCKGEDHLELAANRSIGFAIDLEIERKAVAYQNRTPEQGVKSMESQGALSELQATQLLSCLSKIATGQCMAYQKN